MATKQPNVEVTIKVKVDLSYLAKGLADEIGDVTAEQLLALPGFQKRFIKFIRDDMITGYENGWFEEGLGDSLDGEGDLLEFLTKKLNLDGERADANHSR